MGLAKYPFYFTLFYTTHFHLYNYRPAKMQKQALTKIITLQKK